MIAIIIFVAIVFGVYYLYYAIKAKVKGVSINKAINPNYKTEHEKQQIQKEDEEYRNALEERQRKYQELYSSKNAPKVQVSANKANIDDRINPALLDEKKRVEAGETIQTNTINNPELEQELSDKEKNKQARKEAWNKLTAPKYKKPHYVRNTLLFGILGTIHSSHRDKKNRKNNF